jgi:hypothetical protein
MRLIFRKFVVRVVVPIVALLMCAFGLSLAEQRRTEAELTEVLSTYQVVFSTTFMIGVQVKAF